MDFVQRARVHSGLSQRALARRAEVSFGALQRLEWGKIDPRWSTLARVAAALGYSRRGLERVLGRHLEAGADSVAETSLRVALEGEGSWPLWLFNFVDAYRKTGDAALISLPPAEECGPRPRALFAAAVETLCAERGAAAPAWCRGVAPLEEPWFPSGVENLKASALAESPAHFRKRGIFVLGNFLDRA